MVGAIITIYLLASGVTLWCVSLAFLSYLLWSREGDAWETVAVVIVIFIMTVGGVLLVQAAL